MDISQAIAQQLSTSPALLALVGPRIYVGALPQTLDLAAAGAALTYTILTRPYGHNLGGSDGTSSAHVQFSAWSIDEQDSDQICIAVKALWDGFAGTIGTVQVTACILQDEADLPEPPKAGTDQWIYQVAADYRINHRVSLPASLGA